MVGTDLLFSAMASHIGMLLRLLQRRLETIATTEKSDDDYYTEILENIKLHQRLIRSNWIIFTYIFLPFRVPTFYLLTLKASNALTELLLWALGDHLSSCLFISLIH